MLRKTKCDLESNFLRKKSESTRGRKLEGNRGKEVDRIQLEPRTSFAKGGEREQELTTRTYLVMRHGRKKRGGGSSGAKGYKRKAKERSVCAFSTKAA